MLCNPDRKTNILNANPFQIVYNVSTNNADAYVGLLFVPKEEIQATGSIPNETNKELTKPDREANITENTKPKAIVFVTYGKKYTVWKNPCNFPIPFNATEINKAIITEIGTDTITIIAVFLSALINVPSLNRRTKLPIPKPTNVLVSPIILPAASYSVRTIVSPKCSNQPIA